MQFLLKVRKKAFNLAYWLSAIILPVHKNSLFCVVATERSIIYIYFYVIAIFDGKLRLCTEFIDEYRR